MLTTKASGSDNFLEMTAEASIRTGRPVRTTWRPAWTGASQYEAARCDIHLTMFHQTATAQQGCETTLKQLICQP